MLILEKQKIKVMLINPPRTSFEGSLDFGVHFPIGLLSIAAMIENICEVKVFDSFINNFEVSKTKNITIYGTPFKKIKEEIARFHPNIVGITVPFYTQAGNAKFVGKICKEIDPDLPPKKWTQRRVGVSIKPALN
jgi:hypothetical protein